MASVSALRAEIVRKDEQIASLLYMAQRAPDAWHKTGKIRGSESRYTLRVWHRASGFAECQMVHVHPGQSDSVSGPFDLDSMPAMYRADTEEGRAIHGIIDAARTAHYRSLQPATV